MKPHRRIPLTVEQLEKRDCPALSIIQAPGLLEIQGTPTGPLSITEPAAGQIQIVDNLRNLGTFSANGNLILNLTRHPDLVTIDLMTNRFAGNILISLGLGDPAGHAVSVVDGTLGGSLTVVGGSGAENVDLGGGGGALTAQGPVSVTGANLGPGETLSLFSNSTLSGNLSTALLGTLSLAGTVAGNLSVADAGTTHALVVDIDGSVGKSVSVTGTNLDDSFTLSTVGAGTGIIGGTLSVNLGSSTGPTGDVIDLGANTTVNGNTTLTSAGGPVGGLYTVDGTITANLSVNMGVSGPAASAQDNLLTFGSTAVVYGNMQVTAGNGDNDLTGFMGTVYGQLSITMGNGNDSISVTNAPAGTFYLNLGNGNNSVTLTPAAASNWTINFNFGTGSNSLTLAGTASTLFGSLNSQAPGTNTFTQDAWSNMLSFFNF